MTVVLSICVAVIFAVSIYMMLDRELKSIAMGVFLLGHAANLTIIAMSGSPIIHEQVTDPVTHEVTEHLTSFKTPPILSHGHEVGTAVDPLPQALILTAIVIGFAVMAFLLTLIVMTARKTDTLNVDDLTREAEIAAEE